MGASTTRLRAGCLLTASTTGRVQGRPICIESTLRIEVFGAEIRCDDLEDGPDVRHAQAAHSTAAAAGEDGSILQLHSAQSALISLLF